MRLTEWEKAEIKKGARRSLCVWVTAAFLALAYCSASGIVSGVTGEVVFGIVGLSSGCVAFGMFVSDQLKNEREESQGN